MCFCDQREREDSASKTRVVSDMVDHRGWTEAHFSAFHGTSQLAAGRVPKPSFDALTPPAGSSSLVNIAGPGGITPLMSASMSAAAEAGPHYALMDSHRGSTSIVQDLISVGASTEDRTDFSGTFYGIFTKQTSVSRCHLRDPTLSYREHLSRSATKLNSRNNLIAKQTRWYFMECRHKHPPQISIGSMLLSHRILLSSVG